MSLPCTDHLCPTCRTVFSHDIAYGEICSSMRSSITGLRSLRTCGLCVARRNAPQLELFSTPEMERTLHGEIATK